MFGKLTIVQCNMPHGKYAMRVSAVLTNKLSVQSQCVLFGVSCYNRDVVPRFFYCSVLVDSARVERNVWCILRNGRYKHHGRIWTFVISHRSHNFQTWIILKHLLTQNTHALTTTKRNLIFTTKRPNIHTLCLSSSFILRNNVIGFADCKS